MDMSIHEVLQYLEENHPDWRDYGFIGYFDEWAMDGIAYNFFKANMSWLDDVAPAIIENRFEWVLMAFDPLQTDDFRAHNRKAIWQHIKKAAYEFYLDKEAEGIAYA